MLTPRKGTLKTFSELNIELSTCLISNLIGNSFFIFHRKVGLALLCSLTCQVIFFLCDSCLSQNVLGKVSPNSQSKILCKLLQANCCTNIMKQKFPQVLFNGCWTQQDQTLFYFYWSSGFQVGRIEDIGMSLSEIAEKKKKKKIQCLRKSALGNWQSS